MQDLDISPPEVSSGHLSGQIPPKNTHGQIPGHSPPDIPQDNSPRWQLSVTVRGLLVIVISPS